MGLASPLRLACRRASPGLIAFWLFLVPLAPAAAMDMAPAAGTASERYEWRTDGTSRFISSPQAADAAVTIRTRVHASEAASFDGIDTVWLAGLASRAGAAPTALALAWAPDTTGWGFSWRLQLRSDRDLLPVGLEGKPLSGRWSGSSAIDLARAIPAPGHVYESLLSYDPQSGALSLAVTDVTSGERVYAGGFRVGARAGPLYPVAGVTARNEGREAAPFAFDGLTVYPAYLPIGTDWQTGTRADGSAFLQAWNFERRESLVVRLSVPGPAPRGEYRLLLTARGKEAELARLSPTAAETWLTFPASDLPLGAATLTLRYVENGQVRLFDSREIVVGQISFRFERVTVDREHDSLAGAVWVSSPDTLSGLGLSLRASLFELVWDESRRAYRAEPYRELAVLEQRVDAAPGSEAAIPFRVPLPDRAGLWRIIFQPATDLGLAVETAGAEALFTTYRPAAPATGQAYTIAVLPDTQYYAQSYPEILTRQIQWIAENAPDRNIALMLQLGDMTDDNEPYQWERAEQSIRLLDGVMPYVLALGNHDMAANGAAASRDATAINEYFPVEAFPALGGTFQPGRIENSYHTLRIAGTDYLVVSLEFGPPDEALEWANRVVAAHPGHRVIVITHSYLGASGLHTDSAKRYALALNPETTVNGGDDMWRKLVRRHENIFLVLSGHLYTTTLPRRIAIGEHGNRVYEMLTDYQGDPRGGDGWLVLMRFTPDGKIDVQSYSPYLGEHRSNTDRYGFDNHFVIDTVQGRFVAP